MSNKVRKRYFVSEGELFRLYADIQEVRRTERRDTFLRDFKKLLSEAQEVELTVKEKGGHNDGTL